MVGSPSTAETRQERKARTRQALRDAALRQLEERSFGAISLREVAREAGITPTAFYRHFATMEALGLDLVDGSFRPLRSVLRQARAPVAGSQDEIEASVRTLVARVDADRAHFRFISRERFGGVAALRAAIAHEVDLFVRDLEVDLARYPIMADVHPRTLRTAAGLVVAVMASTVDALLEAPEDDEEARSAIRRTAEDQLRMVLLGALHWARARDADADGRDGVGEGAGDGGRDRIGDGDRPGELPAGAAGRADGPGAGPGPGDAIRPDDTELDGAPPGRGPDDAGPATRA
ncbi:MAG: TetR family transcriptional regulator [Solirubrobacteraceae bacterium]|nr:TetR family transcriptional regulator [Solirubrobacteraceae bacterium]